MVKFGVTNLHVNCVEGHPLWVIEDSYSIAHHDEPFGIEKWASMLPHSSDTADNLAEVMTVIRQHLIAVSGAMMLNWNQFDFDANDDLARLYIVLAQRVMTCTTSEAEAIEHNFAGLRIG